MRVLTASITLTRCLQRQDWVLEVVAGVPSSNASVLDVSSCEFVTDKVGYCVCWWVVLP